MMRSLNFYAWLSDERRRFVPGSLRVGHNVITNFGREWLAQLSAWQTITGTSDDVPYTEHRLRWLGVGGGSQLEQKGVVKLVTPLTITTGPNEYIRQLGTLTWVTDFSARYTTVFTGASSDFDHHGASVDVSEAGLYVDYDDGGGPDLSPADDDNVPVAYKAFDALTKAAAQTLTITWELRF